MTHLLRYRLRTLLFVTVLVAVAIAAFKKFEPNISVQSVVVGPVIMPPISDTRSGRRQLRVTVQNDSLFPIWLTPNDTPVHDWGWDLISDGGPALVILNIDEKNAFTGEILKNQCTKVPAGQTRTYEIGVRAAFDQFRLRVCARDWRGRDGYVDLGPHDTQPQDHGEPTDATESASWGVSKMEDQPRGPGD